MKLMLLAITLSILLVNMGFVASVAFSEPFASSNGVNNPIGPCQPGYHQVISNSSFTCVPDVPPCPIGYYLIGNTSCSSIPVPDFTTTPPSCPAGYYFGPPTNCIPITAFQVTINPNLTQISPNQNPSLPVVPPTSQAQMDCFNKGSCYSFIPSIFNSNCYPTGYIFNGTYCSQSITHDNYAFLNQSKEGQACTQNYECITGICSDNICINITAQENNLTTLIAQYNQIKSQLNTLNNSYQNNTNNTYTNLSASDNSTNKIKLNLVSGNAVKTQNSNIFERIINFFRGLFGGKNGN